MRSVFLVLAVLTGQMHHSTALPPVLRYTQPTTMATPAFDPYVYLYSVNETQWTLVVLCIILLVLYLCRRFYIWVANYYNQSTLLTSFTLMIQISQGNSVIFIPIQQFLGCPQEYHFCGSNLVQAVHLSRQDGRRIIVTWNPVEVTQTLSNTPVHLQNSAKLNLLQYYQLSKILDTSYTCLPVIRHGSFLSYIPICEQCPRKRRSQSKTGSKPKNTSRNMYPQLY